jgi:hypothetical protein
VSSCNKSLLDGVQALQNHRIVLTEETIDEIARRKRWYGSPGNCRAADIAQANKIVLDSAAIRFRLGLFEEVEQIRVSKVDAENLLFLE